MATSGKITTNRFDGRYYTLSWTGEQSIANNQTTINYELSCEGGDVSWYAERTLKAVIAGKTIINKTNRVERYAGTIDRGSFTVTHDTQGEYSFSASLQVACYTSTVNLTASRNFTLDTIPRQATITSAPNFNDESNPVLKYSNPAGSNVTTLQAAILGTDGSTVYAAYRDIEKTGSSYTFSLTDAERNALRNACTTKTSMSVRFYIKTVINGTTFTVYATKTMSVVNANPVIETATAKDTSYTTLTGDSQKMISGYNTVNVAMTATARKGATVTGYTIKNNGHAITSKEGAFINCTDPAFEFIVTDSRGNASSKTVTLTIIDYMKLTTSITGIMYTDGTIVGQASGKCFNGNFGAADNTLTANYRYKTVGGDWSDWGNATVTFSGNSYIAAFAVTELDYRQKYVVQTKVQDKLSGKVSSKEYTVSCVPVFYWNDGVFHFNVPVNVIEDGAVYHLLGAAKALTNSYTLETTVEAGENYTSAEASAVLVGNNLRLFLKMTRDSASGTGSITNEKVAQVTIHHGGKIKAAYNMLACSGGTGGVSTFTTSDLATDDETLSITVLLCATDTALTSANAYFNVPVRLNLGAY